MQFPDWKRERSKAPLYTRWWTRYTLFDPLWVRDPHNHQFLLASAQSLFLYFSWFTHYTFQCTLYTYIYEKLCSHILMFRAVPHRHFSFEFAFFCFAFIFGSDCAKKKRKSLGYIEWLRTIIYLHEQYS